MVAVDVEPGGDDAVLLQGANDVGDGGVGVESEVLAGAGGGAGVDRGVVSGGAVLGRVDGRERDVLLDGVDELADEANEGGLPGGARRRWWSAGCGRTRGAAPRWRGRGGGRSTRAAAPARARP